MLWQKQQDVEELTRNEIVGKGLLVEVLEIQPTGIPGTKTAEMQRKCKSRSSNDLNKRLGTDLKTTKHLLRDPYESSMDIGELERDLKEHFYPAEMSVWR